jgi:DNA-binding transcriptional ArsR family regulator
MDAALRAIADPTRRQILRLVRDDEHSVNEIAEGFAMSRPAISQHLKVLSDADLVSVRREGTRRYYQARSETVTELIRGIETMWDDSLDRLKTASERDEWPERARKAKR